MVTGAKALLLHMTIDEGGWMQRDHPQGFFHKLMLDDQILGMQDYCWGGNR
jgi:hypothetical protein